MIFSLCILLLALGHIECTEELPAVEELPIEPQEPSRPICSLDELLANRAECDKQAAEETSHCVSISFDLDHCGCYYEMDFDCLIAEKKMQIGTRICNDRAKLQPCAFVRSYNLATNDCVIETDHVCQIQNKLIDVVDSVLSRLRE